MSLLQILVYWFILSVPIGLILGNLLAMADLPGKYGN